MSPVNAADVLAETAEAVVMSLLADRTYHSEDVSEDQAVRIVIAKAFEFLSDRAGGGFACLNGMLYQILETGQIVDGHIEAWLIPVVEDHG